MFDGAQVDDAYSENGSRFSLINMKQEVPRMAGDLY